VGAETNFNASFPGGSRKKACEPKRKKGERDKGGRNSAEKTRRVNVELLGCLAADTVFHLLASARNESISERLLLSEERAS